MILPCIDEIINIAGIVQMIKWIAIGKADERFAFKNFAVTHIARYKLMF